jgi:hypothetical protein
MTWVRALPKDLRVLSPRPEKTKEVGNFATAAVKYAAVMGAMLYFSGWLYLYHFYRHFQIDVSMLQLSTQEIVLYSALVIQHVTKHIFGVPGIFITLVAIPLALHLIYRTRSDASRFFAPIDDYNKHYYIPLVLSLLVPALVIGLARSAAIENARAIRVSTSGETATFTFKKDCGAGELSKLNEAEKLKLLAATQKWYFVYAQTGQWTKEGTIVSVDVFHIPTDCVQSAEFLVRHPK